MDGVRSRPPGGDGRRTLAEIRIRTDRLDVGEEGELAIGGVPVTEILQRFGSPCYVIAEDTLRDNFRRIAGAFRTSWPEHVEVLFAIKANNNLAVRRILDQEGAGTDCFGASEMYAAFLAGTDPAKTVLNGSNKTIAELVKAAEVGVTINIDSMDEAEQVMRIAAESDSTVPVTVRLKIVPDLSAESSDYFALTPATLTATVAAEKWGVSAEAAAPIVSLLAAAPRIDLRGYHVHISRLSQDPAIYRKFVAEFVSAIAQVRDRTGFLPRLVDIGGGWPRRRDPESRGLRLNPHEIEDYAREVCVCLREELSRHSIPLPELWLEPGRYIVGNAAVLLSRVGVVKNDLGRSWVNVDASTNNLMRIDTSGSAHHVLPASKMDSPYASRANIVGPTCVDSLLAEDLAVPSLERGDVLAILDAGMYAETTSTQFNGVPRPATVLVKDGIVELIKEQESVGDVFAKHRIPERLTLDEVTP